MAEAVATIAAQPPTSAFRLRTTTAIACLLALVTLTISSRGVYTPPLMALIIGASFFTERRLIGRAQIWTLRGILFALVTAAIAASERSRTAGHWLINTDYSLAFGQLCGAELAVQCWRQVPSGGIRGYSIVLLSGLVFISGCNTNDERFVRWLAPVYTLMVALALRDYRPGQGSRRGTSVSSLAGLFCALMLGGGIYWGFFKYQNEITGLFLRALRERVSEQVGLSDVPVLGPTSNLRGSGMRVLRIDGRFNGGHLRCMAFDTYAQRKWAPTFDKRKMENVPGPALNPNASGDRITITRLSDDFRWVLAPLHSAGVTASGGRVIEGAMRDGGPMRTTIWPNAPYPHDVILSSEKFHQGPLCTPRDSARIDRCRVVSSELEPEVKIMAQQIAGQISDPLERVRAIERYMQENYQYSLTQDPGKGDPISSFLLRTKKGHCEFFASAAVMLLRCVDVPTRYVTGFHAHEWNGVSTMTVRDSDAHAWAESWIDGIGWITVEATPPSGMPAMNKVPWWIKRWEDLKDLIAAVWAWVLDQGWTMILWTSGAGVTVFAAYRLIKLLLTPKRRTAGDAKFDYWSPNPSLQALALRFEKCLKRNGSPCPTHMPWNEHLAEIRKRSAEAPKSASLDLELAESFAIRYNAVRFGNPGDETALKQLREWLEKMER